MYKRMVIFALSIDKLFSHLLVSMFLLFPSRSICQSIKVSTNIFLCFIFLREGLIVFALSINPLVNTLVTPPNSISVSQLAYLYIHLQTLPFHLFIYISMDVKESIYLPTFQNKFISSFYSSIHQSVH